MEEILRRIWGRRKGYVFLPRKKDHWVESGAINWPVSENLDELIDLSADSYFCPQVFSDRKRVKKNALPSNWLYADLDAINPRRLALLPTIALQTSPGRYQGFWELTTALSPSTLEALNQKVTYATGADKGGWHLGKVLRIPDTFNYKYPSRKRVRVLWSDGPTYERSEVVDFVKGVEAHHIEDEIRGLVLPPETRDSIVERIWRKVDERTRDLLRPDTESRIELGDEGRSGLLWELECRLLESGLDPEETFVVVHPSPWNKFRGRPSGDEQLWSEISKAHLHVGSERGVDEHSGLVRVRPRLVSYADLLGSGVTEPDWLVEDWWTLGSHGIIAGLPKSYKSLVSLDLAVSIASETKFMGMYEVNPKGVGPVLIIQQENSPSLLKDRLVKIGQSRGLATGRVSLESNQSLVIEFPPAIPLLFYNDFAFDMTMEEDREAVEKIIQQEGVRMVMFDPLYLMIGAADENNAKDMRPILSWLLRIRNLYSCAVVVIHHWGKGHFGKGGRGTGGVRLLGSTTLYGWLEAALYLEANITPAGIQVVVEREFRERITPPPAGFWLRMGDVGDSAYEWAASGAIGTSNRVVGVIQERDNGATLADLREALDLSEKKLRSEITDLLAEGIIRVETEGRLKRFFHQG